MISEAAFALGCGLCVWAAHHTRDSHARFLSLALLVSWGGTVVARYVGPLYLLPFMDLPIALYALVMRYEDQTSGWKMAFSVLAGAQLAIHCGYEISGGSALYAYILLLNVTFAAELLAVGWEGRRGVFNDCLRSLRAFRGLFAAHAPSLSRDRP